MPVNTARIDVIYDGYSVDLQQRAVYSPDFADKSKVGQNIDDISLYETAIPVGNGVFLTTAHSFDGIKSRAQPYGDIRFIAKSSTVNGSEINQHVYLGNWNSQTYLNGSDRSRNNIDLAIFKSSSMINNQQLAPFLVFQSSEALNSFFASRSKSVLLDGQVSSADQGAYTQITGDATFETTNTSAGGDSGGSISTSFGNRDYILGIVSTGKDSPDGTPLPGTYSSYLTTTDFYKLMSFVSTETGNNFDGLAPDVIFGASRQQGYFRGSQRRGTFLFNGDHSAVLAGGNHDIINTGSGSDDVLFTQIAHNGADSGTTFVVSPGNDVIVGANSNDRLVLLADRLWTTSYGAPSGTELADNSDTIDIVGGVVHKYSDGQTLGYYVPSMIDGGSYGNDGYYYINYDIYDSGSTKDLFITVRAVDGGSGQTSHNNTGYNNNLWTSTITVKNFKDGDLGLKLIDDTSILPPSDPGYSASYQAAVSTLKSVKKQSDFVNDDVTDNWNGKYTEVSADGYNPAESVINTELQNILDIYQDYDPGTQYTPEPFNHGLVANSDNGSVGKNEIQLFDLVANDTDLDSGDDLTLLDFRVGSYVSDYGSVSIDSIESAFTINDGKLLFAPGDQFDFLSDGQAGLIEIQYTVEDSQLNSAVGSFYLRIVGSGVVGDPSSEIDGTDDENTINGGNSNDKIYGRGGNDILIGGRGDDMLYGGAGNDIYRYARGAGDDTVDESDAYAGNADRLVLTDIAPDAVTLTHDRDAVTLVIAPSSPGAGDGGRITLTSQFNPSADRGVEQVVFADGTTWSAQDLRDRLLSQTSTDGDDNLIHGTDGNDTLTAPTDGATVQAGKGDDTISLSGTGADTIRFAKGDGHDTIDNPGSGYTRDDTLVLTDANPDEVVLTRDGDALVVTIADTGETVRVKWQFWQNNTQYGLNRITFADGSTLDRSQIQASSAVRGTAGASGNAYDTRDSSNLVYNLGPGTYTVSAFHDDPLTVDWSASDGDQTFTIESNNYNNDAKAVLSGLNAADVTLSRGGPDNDDLLVTNRATGAVLRFANQFRNPWQGINQIQFADGSTLSHDQIPQNIPTPDDGSAGSGYPPVGGSTGGGGSGGGTPSGGGGSGGSTSSGGGPSTTNPNTTVYGTDGNDRLNGTTGPDVISGGRGDDYLSGGGGGDTYVYNRGDGSDVIDDNNWSGSDGDDRVLFGPGIAQSDVSFSADGTDLIIKLAGTTDQIRVSDGLWAAVNNPNDRVDRIESFQFADGTSLDMNTVQQNLLTGTDGDDHIFGYATADTITGGKGNDRLEGRGGGDTYLYKSGDGNDRIIEHWSGEQPSQNNTLNLSDLESNQVELTRSGDDLLVKDNTTGQMITVEGHFGNNEGIQAISFADGTTWDRTRIQTQAWIRGTAGDDTLSGTDGADTLFGGAGADTFTGGSGADAFVFGPASGQDVITDFQATGANHDLIQFDHAVFADAASALAASSQVGNDVVITISPLDSVVLKNTQLGSLATNDFRIA